VRASLTTPGAAGGGRVAQSDPHSGLGSGAEAQRRLLSYLLLPRPKDTVKAWLLPCTFVIGVASAGRVSSAQLLRLAGVWFALELLIYQARYQWNDIRGFYSDQAHPDVSRRGRLTGPVERARPHKLASALVATLRLLLAMVIGLLLPSGDGLALVVVFGVAVFAVGWVYERVKTCATAGAGEAAASRRAVLGLWFVVGGGYAVRGLAGLALAVDVSRRPLLGLVTTAAVWAYGIAFVTSRWAIESLAFARVSEGQVVWGARPDQARGHLLKLARWLPSAGPEILSGAASPRSWRALLDPTSLGAPWNVAILVSAGCAGASGGLLVRASIPIVAGLAAGCVAATVVVVCSPPRWRVPKLMMCAVTMIALLELARAPGCVVAVAPWFASLSAQIFSRSHSLETMGRGISAALDVALVGWRRDAI
jgi:hypothetical protein